MESNGNGRNFLIFKLLFAVIGAWVAFAVLFGIYDLYISITMVDPSNVFGIFGADYGEGPGWAVFGVGLAVLIGSAFTDLKKQKYSALILSCILVVVFIIGVIIDSEDLMHIGGFIGFSILLFTFITFNYDWKPYRNLAIVIVLLFVINPGLFVNITKPLCGRVRFRNLTPPGYPEFTPWFAPPGPDLHNLSFPSGHTAMGWMVLPLLIPLRNKRTLIKVGGIILIGGWGLFVGLSRIVVGAHYASDVLFSSGVAFIAVILLYKKYYLKEKS